MSYSEPRIILISMRKKYHLSYSDEIFFPGFILFYPMTFLINVVLPIFLRYKCYVVFGKKSYRYKLNPKKILNIEYYMNFP